MRQRSILMPGSVLATVSASAPAFSAASATLRMSDVFGESLRRSVFPVASRAASTTAETAPGSAQTGLRGRSTFGHEMLSSIAEISSRSPRAAESVAN